MMLVKLNPSENLDPRALAHEFGVNVRTIQRDINERFGYVPLEKINGSSRMTLAPATAICIAASKIAGEP